MIKEIIRFSRLATLLEHVNNYFFEVNFKNLESFKYIYIITKLYAYVH